MKTTFSIGLAVMALGLEGDTPQYTCKAGDTRSCAWTRTTETEIKSSTLSIMGENRDIGSDSTSTTSLTLEFNEEVKEATEDGTPAQIVRTYGTITQNQDREGLESTDAMRVVDNDATSQLEGQTVVFKFDQDSEEWDAAFDEEPTGEAEWLEELSPRIDLAEFLPEGDEAPVLGASWDLDPELLAHLMNPGGEVMTAEASEPDDSPEGSISLTVPTGGIDGHFDALEGELAATFSEIVEDGGRRLAKIVIEADLSADIDLTDELEEKAAERGAEESYSEATSSNTIEGEITLLWDLEANCVASVSGEMAGTVEFDAQWSINAGGMDLDVAVATEAVVEYAIAATFGDGLGD